MNNRYSFSKDVEADMLASLKKSWIDTLVSPQDGMWNSFRDSAEEWGVFYGKDLIGYASVGDNNMLLQFYISPHRLKNGGEVFKSFINEFKIQEGIVGTNNPVFLSISLGLVQQLKVHTYMFRNNYEVSIEKKDGNLIRGKEHDLNRIVSFCHESMGAPTEWLSGYIGGLIEKKEIFYLEYNGDLIGTCEVRKSTSSPKYADIGMVVSPKYRRQGYGTYLLHNAKRIANARNMYPICSCEKGNLGSIEDYHFLRQSII